MKATNWHGCYGETWKGLIVDEAFTHPAKFSRALIRRIYDHAFAEGWLRPGDTVVDPFGGVALGALQALRRGVHWVGVELEPRFVRLGRKNLILWRARYGAHFHNWGASRLLQGDSRGLARVLGRAGFAAAVSSPPYQTGGNHKHQMDAWNTNGGGQYGHSGGYADESAGQIQGKGDDFWLAARQVVDQVHQVLAPGGMAIWVTKDFVRNKQRVSFSDQWEALCQAVGFVTVCRHRALQVEHNGTALTLFGDEIENMKVHKSLFRWLTEQKGSPAIDWEDVICMRKV